MSCAGVGSAGPRLIPNCAFGTAIPYDTLIEQTISNERVMATLGGLFGGLGLLIAAVGMFGVLAFQVARRTNELGVRMVLGANRWSVMGLVLRDVVAMLIPGIAIGAGLSLLVTGFARGLLFGRAPNDRTAFVMAASILTSVLTQVGASVTMTASAQEALQVLDVNPPDVLVSDIDLSGEDGYALIRQIRQREAERGGFVPAVALTGYARAEDRARTIAAGFQVHAPKPIEPAMLPAGIAALAREADTRRGAARSGDRVDCRHSRV